MHIQEDISFTQKIKRMKIENLKSTTYKVSGQQLSATVQADSILQVTNSLVGKDELHIYADNEGKDKEVEVIEGYSYLVSVNQLAEGLFELILTDEPPTSQTVREKVIADIEAHDKSGEVNSFTLAGKQMWLDKETRVGLVNSINIEKAAGKETTTLWFDAVQYEIPVDTALQMLAALELYALDCYNVTQSHIASVKLLDDISMLTEYDYTTGYPNKLVFNLNT